MTTHEETQLVKSLKVLDRLVAPLLEGKWWQWKCLGLVVLVTLLFHVPSRDVWMKKGWQGEFLEQKVAHPFTPADPWEYVAPELEKVRAELDPDYVGLTLDTHRGQASHFDKYALRLTIPVIGHVLGTGYLTYPLCAALGGIFIYWCLLSLGMRHFEDRKLALFLTLAFALAWPGFCMFSAAGVKSDLVAWAALLGAIYTRRCWAIALWVVIGSFTDERALVAAGYGFIYWIASAKVASGTQEQREHVARAVAVAVGGCLYLALRFSVERVYGLSTGTTLLADFSIVRGVVEQAIPWKLVPVFELGWVWIALLIFALWAQRAWWLLSMWTVVTGVLMAILFMVWDWDRTLCYLLPSFPLAWLVGGYQQKHAMWLARLSVWVGVLLTIPMATLFRYPFNLLQAWWLG